MLAENNNLLYKNADRDGSAPIYIGRAMAIAPELLKNNNTTIMPLFVNGNAGIKIKR